MVKAWWNQFESEYLTSLTSLSSLDEFHGVPTWLYLYLVIHCQHTQNCKPRPTTKAGCHRAMGAHVSKIKSVTLGTQMYIRSLMVVACWLVPLAAHGRQDETMSSGSTSDPRSLPGWTLGHPRKWKLLSQKVAIRRQVHLGASHHNEVGWTPMTCRAQLPLLLMSPCLF